MKKPAMLTLDVEDWEHANYAQLDNQQSQIQEMVRSQAYAMDANLDRWIEILSQHDAKSTCFVLGEFAERFPKAVKKLQDQGHEIACHGQTHDLVHKMSQSEFREWLKKALGTLGKITGKQPRGFRAPSWSVNLKSCPWFCDELELAGIQYDSSEFPVRTHLYGNANASLKPYWQGKIFRIPVTVMSFGPVRIPFASGAFFRLSPLSVIKMGFKRAEKLDQTLMLVLHPRELDPLHPRLPIKGWEASVHYAKLESTVPKLKNVLDLYRWTSIADVYGAKLAK
jgi:polysaccharide deacetylase family protein (PEP-CTERM system associated)